ncbi:hypothetical protein J5O04_03525 [Corynebacterium hindlerae]|uniref:hypothetical protein n=1 Tax=Corynebacterium hindlerae TaxID=699041 RepID=UPI001AD6BCEA|nr:hypothetical protein [Corynebacterium hindlerae]QTH60209.1 hypothetical protein J5O04_03525 [Corynebacterium hindlerae]
MHTNDIPPILEGFTEYGVIMLLPGAVVTGITFVAQSAMGKEPPMRVAAGCAVGFVGSAVATALAMFVGKFLSGNFGIKHALVWAVFVGIVMALCSHFYNIRGLSVLHLAVAVICGSGLPFWLEYAITGPGDGTGLWAIALIFAWFVVGTTALLVALAMWIARASRGRPGR